MCLISNSYAEALAPSVVAFQGKGSLGSRFRWGHEGETLLMGLVPLYKEEETPEFSVYTYAPRQGYVRTQGEDGSLPEPSHATTLILDFSIQNCEK